MIRVQKKMPVFLVLGLGAVIAAGYVFFAPGRTPEPKAPAAIPKSDVPDIPSAAPEMPGARLTVSTVNGRAQRRRPGDRNWSPVQPGDELFSDDSIRTDKNAVVSLTLGNASRFELAGRSELGVRELTATAQQLDLALGRISVEYGQLSTESPSKRILKITASENGDTDGAVAETRAGKFTVQRVGDEVTVATHMGEVKLTAKAKSVLVGPGAYSRASARKAPRKPEPIPMAVLLKVAAPKKTAKGERRAVISGKADVGADVYVNDTPAAVDDTGRFRAAVPVRPGKNPVRVISRTAWGSANKKVTVNAETGEGEITDAEVRWGKSPKAKRARSKRKTGAK